MAKEVRARLLGLDLVRGLAAYGVVVIHTLGNQPRTPSGVRFVGLCLGFAVPSFLAVSLYLSSGRLLLSGPSGFLRGRLERMIMPYFVWSAIFIAFRASLYLASGRADALRGLVSSPWSLLFLGKASAQLYFIPLLFLGEILAVVIISTLGERLKSPAWVVLFALLGVVLSWFDASRRHPLLSDPRVSDLGQVALTVGSDLLWCLPYVALAFLFQLSAVNRRMRSISGLGALFLAAFVCALNWIGATGAADAYLPFGTRELVIAFGCVAAAVAVSPAVPRSRWIESLAACTFGIYLVHPLAIEASEWALTKAHVLRGGDGSAAGIALIAAVVFAESWLFVSLSMRLPILARFLYGVRPTAR